MRVVTNRMMERKVTKIGNSLGVTMTEALKKIGVDSGDIVSIDIREEAGEIVIKKSERMALPKGVTREFLETLHAVMNEYDETLKGLKDR
ncbi:AbrB family transcriptional regulator [Effusibacillus consociatus]|uniref:AbrB family transcriptional regulator n=1 Tax=Effusibacillus consociatus TaxID=1117041 RepID=A0ABV9Q782_9BACL